MNPLASRQVLSPFLRIRRTFPRILIILLSLAMVPSMTGCKGKKKKAAEEQARLEALAASEREAYLNGIRNQLNDILNYTATDLNDLSAMERELNDLANLEDWQESDILVQIRKARYHLQQERDRLTQANTAPDPVVTPAQNNAASFANRAFSGISNASSTAEANDQIRRTLEKFSSPDAPVLIIISQAGDYDRPTTISRYLDYLKDQQRNPHVVEDVVLDNQGKIREIVLIKSQLRP